MPFYKTENPILLILFIILIILIPALFISCTKSSFEFSSKDDLAKNIIELINNGDTKKLMNIIIQKNEFTKTYYPHFPEAKQDARLSGEDFYRIFIGLQRKAAIFSKIKQYEGRIVSIKSIGEPETVIKTDAFSILRKIPLKLLILDKDAQQIEINDNKILGVVIEQNKKYKLLNVFR